MTQPPAGPEQHYQSGPYPQQTISAPPITSTEKPGLLDIRFTHFLSLKLISVWWVVALIFIAITVVGFVIAGFTELGDNPLLGLFLIAGALVGGVAMAVLTRVVLESVAVLFRIADNTSEMTSRR